jgi:hypothetical protein
LVGIWASISAFDPSCRLDKLKNRNLHHFVQYLTLGPDASGSVKEAKPLGSEPWLRSTCPLLVMGTLWGSPNVFDIASIVISARSFLLTKKQKNVRMAI